MNKIYICKNIKSSILVKLILNKYHKNYDLIYNEDGKPYLKDNSLYFNVSHSGDYIVMIVSDHECGIDIEKLSYKERLINRIITGNEVINNEDDFTKLWTKKEAYLKYLGKGLSYGMNNVDTTKIDINTFKYDNYYISYYVK